jgi:uncharacterized protein YegJ (DUF2314 family)
MEEIVRLKIIVIISTILFLFCGCNDSKHKVGDVVEREGNPAVHMVGDNDISMNLAIEKARNTVDEFIKNIQNPKQNQSYFSVKAMFTDGDNSEHIWLSDVVFDGNKFTGKIGNEPLEVKTVTFGDQVEVLPLKISDWMIVEDNKLIGGYTIRVLRNTMTVDKKKEFDQTIPFKIE